VGLVALKSYLKTRKIDSKIFDLNASFFWYVLENWTDFTKAVQCRLSPGRGVPPGPEFQKVIMDMRLLAVIRDTLLGLGNKVESDFGASRFSPLLLSECIRQIIHTCFFNELFAQNTLIADRVELVADSVLGLMDLTFFHRFLDGFPWNDFQTIGFSLVSESQLPLALLFSGILKKAETSITMVAGGPYISEVIQGLGATPAIYDFFDCLVVHEGESALASIVENTFHTGICHPNVFSITRPKPDFQPFYLEPIQKLPPLGYDDFDLSIYGPWEVSLPFYSSKGCTWGKCAFCSNNFISYREKAVEPVVESMVQAMKATGLKKIVLVDEEVRPKRLGSIASAILAHPEIKLSWFTQTRFYPKLDSLLLARLKQSGLSTIEFGLESGCSKTLERICKGIRLDLVRRVLQDCADIGIGVVLNLMIGFPGESEQDAQQTVSFLKSIRQEIPHLTLSCNTQAVKIYRHSAFYKHPADFGIEQIRSFPLSPTAKWPGHPWVPDFLRQNLGLLNIHGRSAPLEDFGASTIPLGQNPHVSISPEWLFLPADPVSGNGEIASGPMLLRLFKASYDALGTNPTTAAAIQLISKNKITISQLKEQYHQHFSGHEPASVSSNLGRVLSMLNEKGALIFHEN